MIPTTFYVPAKGWRTAFDRAQFDAYKAQGGQAFGHGAKQFEPLRRHGEIR